MEQAKIRAAGDRALMVEFENVISIPVSQKVRSLKFQLEQQPIDGVLETVPTYRSLLVQYDPAVVRYGELAKRIEDRLGALSEISLPPAVITEIPVCYEGEYAMDLDEIAGLEHKTTDEVIRIHSQSDYYVYMLGFAPGHPYCARFENPFSFKRRESPRVKINGGSIVVQLELSDIIPFDQPCGWNIIGTTPVLPCDFRKENPFVLKAGQWIRHVPVTAQEFGRIKAEVEQGTYRFVTRDYEGTGRDHV